MKKRVVRALIVIALIIYGIVVASWWVEGNRNEAKWESERASETTSENSVFGH